MARTYVFGLLSARCNNRARKTWNALLKEKKTDGFFDFYRTETTADLELRLAEMFHLGRRAYIVSEPLRPLVRPLLDRIDSSVESEADTVINEGGVLVGYSLGALEPSAQLEAWIGKSKSAFSD